MGTNAVQRGLVGAATAAMVEEVRKRRQMTQRDLSERLTELGRPMRPSAVAKIEAGDRRVDVDDLVTLAAALNVRPARLLLADVDADDEVSLAPNLSIPAWAAWDWANGTNPIPTQEDHTNTDEEHQRFDDEVPVEVRQREQHPAARSCHQLWFRVRRVVHHATKRPVDRSTAGGGLATSLQMARQQLRRLADELDLIEAAAQEED